MTWVRISSLLIGGACAVALPVGSALGQGDGASITEKAVGTTLKFLSSDELGGRDSPSPGLDRAAEFIAKRFRAAGLEPVGDERGYYLGYQLPGAVVDLGALKMTVHGADGDRVLVHGADFRVWRARGAFTAERVELLRLRMDQPEARSLARRLRGKSPACFEVATDDALWTANDRARLEYLTGRRGGRASAPWLLVREGVLPAGDVTVSLRLPEPKATSVELRNVGGVLRGKRKDEYVMFSAHYDHVGIGAPQGGDAIYNGADDNGSGTTAVLTLADAFAKSGEVPERSLLFVCFSAEEKGLRGARAFAAKPPIPLESITACVNIEMIGRPPENGRMQAWVTGNDLSDFEAIAERGFARAKIEVVPFRMASGLFRASDNYPLAQKGVVAHSISAGTLHADYHRPGDEFAKIDVEHMTAVIRGLREVGREFASMKGRPMWNERGREALRLGR